MNNQYLYERRAKELLHLLYFHFIPFTVFNAPYYLTLSWMYLQCSLIFATETYLFYNLGVHIKFSNLEEYLIIGFQ